MFKKIRKSLSAKIIIVLVVLIIVIGGVLEYFSITSANNTIREYYDKICGIVALDCEENIRYFLNHSDSGDGEASIDVVIKEVKKYCENGYMDVVYAVIKQIPDGLVSGELDKETHLIFKVDKNSVDISKEEINELVKGAMFIKDDSQTTSYQAENKEINGKKIVTSYCEFVYVDENTNNQYACIVGIDLGMEHYRSIVFKFLLDSFGITLIILILALITITLLIQLLIVGRVKKLSKEMNNYTLSKPDEFIPVEVKGSDEIAQATSAYNSMALSIKNYIATVNNYEIEKEREYTEQRIAADIQKGFLPCIAFDNDKFLVRCKALSAKEVAGDFYYYTKLDENRMAITIGDVSGKGISAALFMSKVIASVKYHFANDILPSEILSEINKEIVEENPQNVFVTLFVGIVDAKNHTLTFSNAGHNPPLVLGKEIRVLTQANGLLAGLFDDATYEDFTINFNDDEELFLYTDGVTEAVSKDKKFFGLDRLINVLKNKRKFLIKEVINALNEFTDNNLQHDDITILRLQIKGNPRREFKAAKESIKELKEYIFSSEEISPTDRNKVYLAVEELFVNIYSYGYDEGTSGTIGVSIRTNNGILKITIDDDAKKYNPLEEVSDIDDYDLDAGVGGLGQIIALTIMDNAEYKYENGKNVLTLYKKLNITFE